MIISSNSLRICIIVIFPSLCVDAPPQCRFLYLPDELESILIVTECPHSGFDSEALKSRHQTQTMKILPNGATETLLGATPVAIIVQPGTAIEVETLYPVSHYTHVLTAWGVSGWPRSEIN